MFSSDTEHQVATAAGDLGGLILNEVRWYSINIIIQHSGKDDIRNIIMECIDLPFSREGYNNIIASIKKLGLAYWS